MTTYDGTTVEEYSIEFLERPTTNQWTRVNLTHNLDFAKADYLHRVTTEPHLTWRVMHRTVVTTIVTSQWEQVLV